MSRLQRFALALVLGTTAVCCSAEVEEQAPAITPAGDLCELSCARRADRGCVVEPAACTETCGLARAAGYCTTELDTSLACVVDAEVLNCGRAPNGGSCDAEALALERCLALHAFTDAPPDCYGNECTRECGPVGQKLCAPGATYLCECPSGAPGEGRCSSDGCYWTPCDCAE